MIPFEIISLFFVASVLLGVAPGPDNIYVLTQSAIHGRKAGLAVTLGLCTGLLGHTAAVALGLAALFATSAFAFTIVKLIGAAYLLYLAWLAFRAGNTKINNGVDATLSLRRLYLRGVIMNISNPKVAIFFLAFLPQFADPVRGSLTLQLLLLGVIFIGATLLLFGSIAWFAASLGGWLKRSPRAQITMNRITGTLFTGLALRLATSER